ncbi:hypothetical protein TNCT_712291, partial [Trichonephila clavata]
TLMELQREVADAGIISPTNIDLLPLDSS